MAKTEMIRARVEPELKRQAEELFSALGLSVTAALTLFYTQVTVHHGLPFAVQAPKTETIKALLLRCGRPTREKTSPHTPTWKHSTPGPVDRCTSSPRRASNGTASAPGNAARVSTRSGVSSRDSS